VYCRERHAQTGDRVVLGFFPLIESLEEGSAIAMVAVRRWI
jgi:hypothetical protein